MCDDGIQSMPEIKEGDPGIALFSASLPPEIVKLIQLLDKVQGCELIGRFRLN